jgi:leucyl/phenylalanyl-tRNA--protein transferase
VKSDLYEVTIDKDFEQLIDACAAPAEDRQDTWINQPIRNLFLELHGLGVAHSVECWRDGELAGGLYGMALAGAFFGESMVSLQRDASKVALVHLVARLITGGYTLLDTQFTTPHLESLGCVEVSREDYQQRLAKALENQGRFGALPAPISGVEALQSITQTS